MKTACLLITLALVISSVISRRIADDEENYFKRPDDRPSLEDTLFKRRGFYRHFHDPAPVNSECKECFESCKLDGLSDSFCHDDCSC